MFVLILQHLFPIIPPPPLRDDPASVCFPLPAAREEKRREGVIFQKWPSGEKEKDNRGEGFFFGGGGRFCRLVLSFC